MTSIAAPELVRLAALYQARGKGLAEYDQFADAFAPAWPYVLPVLAEVERLEMERALDPNLDKLYQSFRKLQAIKP